MSFKFSYQSRAAGLASSTSSAFTNVTPALIASPVSSPFVCSREYDPTPIPRPPNSFILFRTSRVEEINEQHRDTGQTQNQADLSRMLGREWKSLPEAKKREWEEKARIEKHLHGEKYPHYRYRPRRKSKKNALKKAKKPSSAEDLALGPPQTYNSPPHLDPVLPYGAGCNNHSLTFPSSTWPGPSANHLPFPHLNTYLEFMSLDQLSGTTFETFYHLESQYDTVTHIRG